MDGESRNLQNEFFNAARKGRVTLTVFLGNGKRLTGRVKSFDKFTLLLESHQGEQIVFKHAISTVSAGSRATEGFEERNGGVESVDRQPVHGGRD